MAHRLLQFLEELVGSIVSFMCGETFGDTLIVIFTGVVALSTAVYAFLTWKLVSETRRMRRAQTEPRVSLRVEPAFRGMELVIRNEGQGTAKNIRFDFEGDAYYFEDPLRVGPDGQRVAVIEQLSVIKDGLPYLEPRQTLRYFLGRPELNNIGQDPWIFHSKYESLSGDLKEDTYIVDFSQFKGVAYDMDWLGDIAESLRRIRMDGGS